ncbi:hypothetical protein N7523_003769 [Penicillium sp. IBT 18751x]|nr:hypothetical protein N7523_003769 [Penicillium sp. IBT 18751x]
MSREESKTFSHLQFSDPNPGKSSDQISLSAHLPPNNPDRILFCTSFCLLSLTYGLGLFIYVDDIGVCTTMVGMYITSMPLQA